MSAENIKTETVPQYSGDDGLSQGGRKICKAIHQYSKGKISSENMDVLMDIGHGCMVVRNYIYQRYGGIKSLVKVYSSYEIDSEVRTTGFREKIGLPSVYFSPSVSRALADIKIMWAQVRNGINDSVSRNERFSPEDRHYIRFVLKTDVCYWNILNRKSVPLPEKIQSGYKKVIADLGSGSGQRIKNLNRYMQTDEEETAQAAHGQRIAFYHKKAGIQIR